MKNYPVYKELDIISFYCQILCGHGIGQGTKIFKYCTYLAGPMTYNFHSSCKDIHLSFNSICNKEHKGVIRNMTSSSNSFQSTRPTE